MREFVHVVFAFSSDEYNDLFEELNSYKNDVEVLKIDSELEWEDDAVISQYFLVDAKVNSEFLTVLRLTNPHLTKNIQVSYIPDELKNKYRKQDS